MLEQQLLEEEEARKLEEVDNDFAHTHAKTIAHPRANHHTHAHVQLTHLIV